MEVWGEELWEILRPIIVKLGPARVVRKLDEEGIFIEDVDGAVDLDAISDERAIGMLDNEAAAPDRCAELAAAVAASFGRPGRSYDFDSGFPGSGQVNSSWRLGGWSFVVNSEIGVYEVHEDVRKARKAVKPK